jgi:hypothetical protein
MKLSVPILSRLCCLGNLLFSVVVCTAELPATDAQLKAKAERLQAIVEQKLLQQHGMIPMLVRASDYQLPTTDDYRGAYRHRHLRGKSEAELGLPPMHVWRAWENTAANTAYYLHAMAYQYRTTRDPATLAICRRTLAALKYIYTLPIEKGEKGFLCKPYGGIYSNQSSGDQLQCVAWGLAAYRPLAPPEDAADIDTMAVDFARFAMKHDYTSPHGYFGRSASDLKEEPKGQIMDWRRATIFLPILYLAWQGSGDAEFAREISRIYDEAGREKRFGVKTDRFSTTAFGPARRNIYLPSLLMDCDPTHETVWREAMITNYRQARTGLLKDGRWPTAWSYDSKKGRVKIEEYPEVGGGVGKTGRSALFAMCCVAAQRWCPDENMKSDARRILEGLDEATLRFVMPLDDEHPLPPEWEVESKMLDTDCLTGWLCAYWEGRFRGYW